MRVRRQFMPLILLTIFLAAGLIVLSIAPAARADMATGLEAFAVKDYKRAFREFNAAWQAGDAGAAYNIGMMYDGGYGVRNSNMEAAKWYRLAADRGIVEAMNVLGVYYSRGVGVRRDLHMALQLFFKAASAGHAPALYALGAMYFTGLGPLKEDIPKALELFTTSANAGHPAAQFALAQILLEHEEVEPDMITAWQWLALAADGGERRAKRMLDKLTKKMPAADLEKAKAAYNSIKTAQKVVPARKKEK